MEQKQGLSKKQMKKLKQQEKLKQKQEQDIPQKQQSTLKPATKDNQKTIKQQNKPIPRQTPSVSSQQQEDDQPLEQNDGDIDFNQLQHQDQQNIDVTFLIAEIREEYYHSMKTVLLRYGQVVGLTESQLAGEILEKGNLGNVIVAEDDEDQQQEEDQEEDEQKPEENDELNVYSVITLLPQNAKVTQKIKKQATNSLQRNKSTPQKHYTKLRQILSTPKSCSLLLSARLPNLPSFIVCDSHEVFVSDLQETRKKNAKNPIFQSEYILNVSEVEITANQTQNLDELIFSKYEDYEFCQKSVVWWVGENVKSQRQKADLRRLYFVIRLKDYFEAAKNVRSYLDDNQA